MLTATKHYPNDLRKDWEVAKARVGAEYAGKTLEDFTRMNTKVNLVTRG